MESVPLDMAVGQHLKVELGMVCGREVGLKPAKMPLFLLNNPARFLGGRGILEVHGGGWGGLNSFAARREKVQVVLFKCKMGEGGVSTGWVAC